MTDKNRLFRLLSPKIACQCRQATGWKEEQQWESMKCVFQGFVPMGEPVDLQCQSALPKTHSQQLQQTGGEVMNEELKVLKVSTDPKDSQMLMYCQFGSLPVQAIKPVQLAERIRKEIDEVTSTERFLKGDPVAQPARDIVEASDLSRWLFEEGLYTEAGEKYRAEYLSSLPQYRERLCRLIPALKSLEVNFEEGLYDEGLERLKQYLIESGIAAEMWEREFCNGFGG